jgi:hypothetical protein
MLPAQQHRRIGRLGLLAIATGSTLFTASGCSGDSGDPPKANYGGGNRSCHAPLGFGWCPRPDVPSPYTTFVHMHQLT